MKAPTSLLELQEKIQKAVREESFSAQAENLIADLPPLSPSARLKIYQEAFLLRMIALFSSDFTRVKENLGEEKFNDLIQSFVIERPSHYSSISEFGQDFPLFLKHQSDDWYILASLDWLELLSFYALDDESKFLTPEEIQNGCPFKIVLKNATHFFSYSKKYYVSSKNKEEIFVQEIDQKDYLCLTEMKATKDLEQFYVLLKKYEIDLTQTQQKISSWLERGILACERI